MAAVLNRYPAWKYIVLIIIVIGGLIYAAPNLFGEDPAVQITGNETTQVSSATVTAAQQTLNQNKIAYNDINLIDNKVVVRLDNLDDQQTARELLQTALGEQYSVAINLVPATPAWLAALGGSPMKLGLDLRGGVHFLLQVDVDSILQAREKNDMRAIADNLQQANIRYAGIMVAPTNDGLSIRFRDADTRSNAQALLTNKYTDYGFTTAQNNGAYLLNLTLTPSALAAVRDYTMSQTIQVLNNRVNALGVAESVVARQGLDRISVDLPGVQDTAQARQILGGNATLEMHLVDDTADLQSAQQGMVPLGDSLYHMMDGSPIVLKTQVVLTGDAITNATAGFDQNGQAAVNIRATGAQIPEFHRITGENIGKRMAIVLIDVKNTTTNVNGQMVNQTQKVQTVISAPVIQSALPGDFQVTGLGSTQMAQNLAIKLRSGTTPANMYPLQELLVGPTLGKANIHYGLLSVVIGFVVIALFMLFYYRLFGLFAVIALAMNLVLIVALMSMIGFTLSLPGMAAIVLTVGMAVDANVLIFERIREELRNGTSPQAAIHAGYERAFATIIDANVTTLIVAIVLFALATSNIKGFAITLIVGLITSMITAIMGTRGLVNLVYGGRNIKKLSIGI